MFKNTLKKKITLITGEPILGPKGKHIIPSNSAWPLIYKQNLY